MSMTIPGKNKLYSPLLTGLILLIALFCVVGKATAITVTQTPPAQVAFNTVFSITPETDVAVVRWQKVFGPDWVSVNPKTGETSGTANDIGEAHYVRIRATAAGGQHDDMTFILIVGSQNVFYMDGVDTNPASLQESLNVMDSGDVLIIPDGIYTGDANTFDGQRGWIRIDSGSAGNYTTWIAETPDGAQFPRIDIQGAEYIAIKGLSVTGGMQVSGTRTTPVKANHVKIMMCSTRDGGFQVLNGAQYVLMEDVFAYGDSRSVFRVGSKKSWEAPSDSSQYVIFRRAVARHDYTTSRNPVATFMQYGGDNILCQNCIVIDQPPDFTATNVRYGAFETKWGNNFHIKDSMVVNVVDEFHFGDTETDNIQFMNTVFWGVGTGSRAYSENTRYDNLTIGDVNAQDTGNTFDNPNDDPTIFFTDSVFYDIEGTGTESGFRSKRILYQADESTNNLFYPIQTDIIIGDTTDVITGINPVTGNAGNGKPGILYPIRIEGGSDAAEHGLGATILYKRGRSGTLWGEAGYDDLLAEPLWPWAYQSEVKDRMATGDIPQGSIAEFPDINVAGARGFATPGQTLTNYIWGYLGNTLPPFNVTSLAGNGKATLYWDAPEGDALPPVTAFKVYNVTGLDLTTVQVPGTLTPVATVDGNTTYSATIEGLTNGNTYTFAVTAVANGGESSYSYISSATPIGPLPDNADTDNDGMPNSWEQEYGLNSQNAADANYDADSDGLTNLQEYQAGSNPQNEDTDQDGLSDKYEVDNDLDPTDSICPSWICKGNSWRNAIPLLN